MVRAIQTKRMTLMALFMVLAMLAIIFVLDNGIQSEADSYDLEIQKQREKFQSNADTHKLKAEAEPISGENPTIIAKEKYLLKYALNGSMFNAEGRSVSIGGGIITSIVHSFSPEVEKSVAKMMVDPPHQQAFYANSPALLWHKDELIVVLRIWLEKEKYWEIKKWPYNMFQDNFFYTQKFDKYFNPLTPGEIMGIPTPKNWDIGDGPIEPRIFKVKEDTIFVTFNTGVLFPDGRAIDFTLFWNYLQHNVIIPDIVGGSPMVKNSDPKGLARDKHWCALIDHGQLYFVYNIDPLRVMKCKINGTCEFVHFEGPRNYKFADFAEHLRGGTPFELYQYPYYVGVAHVTLFKSTSSHRVYTANLVVLHVKPYRIVYVSESIQLHAEVMNSVPIVRFIYIDDPFIFPVGIILEDADTLYLGVHINDHSSVVMKIQGLKQIMINVISHDKIHATRTGPPISAIQEYIYDTVSRETGYEFYKNGP